MLSHYDNQSRLPLLLLRCTGVLGCQVDLVCERLDMQEVLFVDTAWYGVSRQGALTGMTVPGTDDVLS